MTDRFSNAFECYEAIGQYLREWAPKPWDQITVDFKIIEIDDVSERSITYIPRGSSRLGEFSIRDTNFTQCFFNLARVTSSPDKGFFRTCSFRLYSDGRYEADFGY